MFVKMIQLGGTYIKVYCTKKENQIESNTFRTNIIYSFNRNGTPGLL